MDRDKLTTYFGRHLVALCLVTKFRDEQLRFNAFSGTLIRVDGSLLWLTAGHNIREIDRVFDSDDVLVQKTVFADAFGSQYVSPQPVPIDYAASTRMFVDDDDGLDFGVVEIHPYHERLLAANGVIALDEANWIRQGTVDFDAYMLMGLPSELNSEFLPVNGHGEVSPTMITVKKVADVPAEHRRASPRLATRIVDPIPLESIEGMSGGPIFGFSLGPAGLRYWIVAIQSTWLAGSRTLFACPLLVIGPKLTEWVRSRRDGADAIPHGS